MHFISPEVKHHSFNYLTYADERIQVMFSNIEFLRATFGPLNAILFFAMLLGIIIQIKDKKYIKIYVSILYFYFGYFLLSFINKGPLVYWLIFPLFPLMYLTASSLINSRVKDTVICIFLVIMVLNLKQAVFDINMSSVYIGKDVQSWKFLDIVAKKVFQGKEKTFGYFVYAPDSFAYGEKYAMYYERSKSLKKAEYFTKMPITYVIAEPPPVNNPYMESNWWIKDAVKINAKSAVIYNFQNGYQILKYNLTEAQINVSFDPSLDPGINFR